MVLLFSYCYLQLEGISMANLDAAHILEVEFYSPSPMRFFRVNCPTTTRFLDLLNAKSTIGQEEGFLESLLPVSIDVVGSQLIYFRTESLEIVALSDSTERKGSGYPFVSKKNATCGGGSNRLLCIR